MPARVTADGGSPAAKRAAQEPRPCSRVLVIDRSREEETMGRGILLWLLGVPIPVIILLWLFFGH
jgi:hypothetical protein